MIDWSRVNELREEIGPEDFDEVRDLFLQEVDEVISRLRSDPDPLRLEGELHFLKGSALNLGFAQFSALCQRGEHLAATGQSAQVDVAEILASFDASRTLFQAGLPERSAS